jgi:hypothetical protein
MQNLRTWKYCTREDSKVDIEGRLIFEIPLTLTLSPDAGEREPKRQTFAIDLAAGIVLRHLFDATAGLEQTPR